MTLGQCLYLSESQWLGVVRVTWKGCGKSKRANRHKGQPTWCTASTVYVHLRVSIEAPSGLCALKSIHTHHTPRLPVRSKTATLPPPALAGPWHSVLPACCVPVTRLTSSTPLGLFLLPQPYWPQDLCTCCSLTSNPLLPERLTFISFRSLSDVTFFWRFFLTTLLELDH